MKYILQIYTGFSDTSCYRTEEMIDRIRTITSRIRVDKIIIGWSREASVYRKLATFLHERGIQMLLWLPAFSEGIEGFRPDQAMDVFGKPVIGPESTEDQSFHFVCPSSGHNARIVTDTFEKHFSDCGFDGVFLDRIRSQSFETGISGVLSCACKRCRKSFSEKGVNIDEVRNLYEEQGDAFFDMESWPMNGEFVLEKLSAQRFFEAKEKIIAEAVIGLAGYFRSKGLIVGLDLFAPVISRFVGQNYLLIAKAADFIKPMLYRKTEAPAGIGYEYALFEKYAPGARSELKPVMDKDFLYSQLQAVKDLPCEQYPGIEINYDKDLVKTDAEYIRESLAAIRECGLDRAAMCWDIMQAPEAHIEAAAAIRGERHCRTAQKDG